MFLLATNWHAFTVVAVDSATSLRGVFTWLTAPPHLCPWRGSSRADLHSSLMSPFSPSPHSNISKTVFQSLCNITMKSFPCCSQSTRGNFLTMSPEDGGCKTAFQTRQLLFTKRFKDSITFFPQTSTGTICWCMSCVSLPLEGGECWYTITCRQQRKILDAFCYSDRHIYFPMHHLPDRCKDVGKPGIRINRVIVLALHILICMNLIFSQAQRAINGKSYSNHYFFWATHTAPPTAQVHKCKKTQARVCTNKGCKVAKMCDIFSS